MVSMLQNIYEIAEKTQNNTLKVTTSILVPAKPKQTQQQ